MYRSKLKLLENILLVSTIVSLFISFLFGTGFFRSISSILLLALSTGYFFLTGLIFNKEKKTIPWFSIFIGIIYSIALIGIVFYINGIPGDSIFISLSFSLLLFVFLPISFLNRRKDPKYFIPHCIRSILIGLCCLVIWLSGLWQ